MTVVLVKNPVFDTLRVAIAIVLCGVLLRDKKLFAAATPRRTLAEGVWRKDAAQYVESLDSILYPPGDCMKTRFHQTRTHPIYNFLHTYYRYSAQSLRKYTPGPSVVLEGAKRTCDVLDHKYMIIDGQGGRYKLPNPKDPGTKFGWITLKKNQDILKATVTRQPFFGCFGLHEWAMLYSGRRSGVIAPLDKHQPWLPLRVSQETIDDVVETSTLRCTHYDAFRFFHPEAQTINTITPLTRASQKDYEQPGCVHATMDLFKYAYQLYPFVSSDLLLETLKVAVIARKIDIRASPYDATQYEECGEPLCIETQEGRSQYVAEQESLAEKAIPIRGQLIEAYDIALNEYLSSPSS
jgi:hypothetical protein